MKKTSLFSAVLFALVFTSAGLQCQQLTIQTDSGKQVILNRADLEALPHIKVTASEHSFGPVNFEGVTLKSVLEKAGVALGESTNALESSVFAAYLGGWNPSSK